MSLKIIDGTPIAISKFLREEEMKENGERKIIGRIINEIPLRIIKKVIFKKGLFGNKIEIELKCFGKN